jgi:hypothetical protein
MLSGQKHRHQAPIPGLKTVGNVLMIPEFGVVALAEVEVGAEPADSADEPRSRHSDASGMSVNGGPHMSNYFHLTMLEMELGCIGHGSVSMAKANSNGNTYP